MVHSRAIPEHGLNDMSPKELLLMLNQNGFLDTKFSYLWPISEELLHDRA
jgi:hypothetical protein